MTTKTSKKPRIVSMAATEKMVTFEHDIRQNSNDIKELTVIVTRLATMAESSEKRHGTDMEVVKEVAANLNKLSERINAVVSMEKDIATIRDAISDKTGDIRTLRHDLNNMAQAMAGIALLNDKITESAKTIAEQGIKIVALETWRNKVEGAGSAIKGIGSAIWAMFGTGVGALVIYVLHSYFAHGTSL